MSILHYTCLIDWQVICYLMQRGVEGRAVISAYSDWLLPIPPTVLKILREKYHCYGK